MASLRILLAVVILAFIGSHCHGQRPPGIGVYSFIKYIDAIFYLLLLLFINFLQPKSQNSGERKKVVALFLLLLAK